MHGVEEHPWQECWERSCSFSLGEPKLVCFGSSGAEGRGSTHEDRRRRAELARPYAVVWSRAAKEYLSPEREPPTQKL